MNHWLEEELTWLTCAERQRELDAYRKQNDFNGSQVDWTFTARIALKLSDWLIATGESLRRRHEKNSAVSYWVNVRKFAR